jgi:hypothetical protein
MHVNDGNLYHVLPFNGCQRCTGECVYPSWSPKIVSPGPLGYLDVPSGGNGCLKIVAYSRYSFMEERPKIQSESTNLSACSGDTTRWAPFMVIKVITRKSVDDRGHGVTRLVTDRVRTSGLAKGRHAKGRHRADTEELFEVDVSIVAQK